MVAARAFRDADRIAAAAADTSIARAETLLVVVGRGTNDPDANSNISKIARMLWEGMGFGWAEIAAWQERNPSDPAVSALVRTHADPSGR